MPQGAEFNPEQAGRAPTSDEKTGRGGLLIATTATANCISRLASAGFLATGGGDRERVDLVLLPPRQKTGMALRICFFWS